MGHHRLARRGAVVLVLPLLLPGCSLVADEQPAHYDARAVEHRLRGASVDIGRCFPGVAGVELQCLGGDITVAVYANVAETVRRENFARRFDPPPRVARLENVLIVQARGDASTFQRARRALRTLRR